MRQNRSKISLVVLYDDFSSRLRRVAEAVPRHEQVSRLRGTYTTGESKGIYASTYDAHTGKLTSLGVAAETENPSSSPWSPTAIFSMPVNELQKIPRSPAAVVSAFRRRSRLASSHS